MKHKHAELIHAWADGALIQFYSDLHSEWLICLGSTLTWDTNLNYRVKPDCVYALNQIREIGDDEAVELYLYWLGGGEVEIRITNQELDWSIFVLEDDPFLAFTTNTHCFEYRKKKRKQVVYEVMYLKPNINRWRLLNELKTQEQIDTDGRNLKKTGREFEVEL